MGGHPDTGTSLLDKCVVPKVHTGCPEVVAVQRAISPFGSIRTRRDGGSHRGVWGRVGGEIGAAAPPQFHPLPGPPDKKGRCHFDRRERSPPGLQNLVLKLVKTLSGHHQPPTARILIRAAAGGRSIIESAKKKHGIFLNTPTAKCIELSEAGAVQRAISRCDQRKPAWMRSLTLSWLHLMSR